MMKTIGYYLLLILVLVSCSSESIKQKINKTGDAAGQAIGEFASGVSSGVEKAVQPKIEMAEGLKNAGIEFGKTVVSSDSSGNDNILEVYIIFNQKYNGKLTAKVFDGKNLEMGRAKMELTGEKDDARYIEFRFDKRTDIDNDSRITIE